MIYARSISEVWEFKWIFLFYFEMSFNFSIMIMYYLCNYNIKILFFTLKQRLLLKSGKKTREGSIFPVNQYCNS